MPINICAEPLEPFPAVPARAFEIEGYKVILSGHFIGRYRQYVQSNMTNAEVEVRVTRGLQNREYQQFHFRRGHHKATKYLIDKTMIFAVDYRAEVLHFITAYPSVGCGWYERAWSMGWRGIPFDWDKLIKGVGK